MIERIPLHDRAYLNCHNIMWLTPFTFNQNIIERLFYSLAPYDASNAIIAQLKEDFGDGEE